MDGLRRLPRKTLCSFAAYRLQLSAFVDLVAPLVVALVALLVVDLVVLLVVDLVVPLVVIADLPASVFCGTRNTVHRRPQLQPIVPRPRQKPRSPKEGMTPALR